MSQLSRQIYRKLKTERNIRVLELRIASQVANAFLNQLTLEQIRQDLEHLVLRRWPVRRRAWVLTRDDIARELGEKLQDPEIKKIPRLAESNTISDLTILPNGTTSCYSVNVPWKVNKKECGFFTFQFDVHNGPRRLKTWEDSWAKSLPGMFIDSKPYELSINENGMELFCGWLQDAGLASEVVDFNDDKAIKIWYSRFQYFADDEAEWHEFLKDAKIVNVHLVNEPGEFYQRFGKEIEKSKIKRVIRR